MFEVRIGATKRSVDFRIRTIFARCGTCSLEWDICFESCEKCMLHNEKHWKCFFFIYCNDVFLTLLFIFALPILAICFGVGVYVLVFAVGLLFFKFCVNNKLMYGEKFISFEQEKNIKIMTIRSSSILHALAIIFNYRIIMYTWQKNGRCKWS